MPDDEPVAGQSTNEGGMDVSGLLRNRIFWIGVFVPVALGAVFLAGWRYTRRSGECRSQPEPSRGSSHKRQLSHRAAASMSALANTPTVALPDSTANAVTGINDPSGLAGREFSSVREWWISRRRTCSWPMSALLAPRSTPPGPVAARLPSSTCFALRAARMSSTIRHRSLWACTTSSNGALSQIAGLVPDSVQGVTVDEELEFSVGDLA